MTSPLRWLKQRIDHDPSAREHVEGEVARTPRLGAGDVPESMRGLSDEKWLAKLIASTHSRFVDGVAFPGFPDQETQAEFVGSADEQSLREAFEFYRFVKQSAKRAGRRVHGGTRLLDFGCGWGRFLRFFWKDINAGNLFGCDTNHRIVQLCRELDVPGQVDLISPAGRLPYADSSFDLVMAYSVFTHLPETVHRSAMTELARVTRPGGLMVMTVEPRRFLTFISELPSHPNQAWHAALTKFKPEIPDMLTTYHDRGFVFLPTNPGVEDIYGDAVVSPAWLRDQWSPLYRVLDYVDDPSRFWQAVALLERA